MVISILYLEGLKWVATIISIALAHTLHVHATANVVNVSHITAEAEKYQGVFFPNPVKKLMTGRLRTCSGIIK